MGVATGIASPVPEISDQSPDYRVQVKVDWSDGLGTTHSMNHGGASCYHPSPGRVAKQIGIFLVYRIGSHEKRLSMMSSVVRNLSKVETLFNGTMKIDSTLRSVNITPNGDPDLVPEPLRSYILWSNLSRRCFDAKYSTKNVETEASIRKSTDLVKIYERSLGVAERASASLSDNPVALRCIDNAKLQLKKANETLEALIEEREAYNKRISDQERERDDMRLFVDATFLQYITDAAAQPNH
jgi:hypothetical protein